MRQPRQAFRETPGVSATRGWRMRFACACAGVSALAFIPLEAGAVFTDIGTLNQVRHQLLIRVGSNVAGSVDTLNFGTIAGDKVGDGATQPTASTDIEVKAWTFSLGLFNTNRTVTVTADSRGGMTCTTPATCGSVIIPLDKVSWSSSNATAPAGGVFDMQSGVFSGGPSQLLATFPSQRRMQNSLTFKFANDTLYPAGTYRGMVTFTASMP